MKFSHKNIPCVVKDVDLGISRCMGFKSRALFCPVSPRPTLVPEYSNEIELHRMRRTQ